MTWGDTTELFADSKARRFRAGDAATKFMWVQALSKHVKREREEEV
jgi:hypothetical protein